VTAVDSALQLRLVRTLGPLIEPALPAATDRPGALADALCPRCRRLLTWAAFTSVTAEGEMVCTACREAERRLTPARVALRLLRLPGTYVALLTLLSALAWALGLGRSDAATMRKLDARRPWYLQQLPRRFLVQGARAQAYADILRKRERPADLQARAALALTAYNLAAELWQGTPAEPYLRLAAARLLADLGQPRDGLALALKLAPTLEADAKTKATYLYHRGCLHLAAGNAAAGRADLEEVIRLTKDDAGDLVDFSALDQLLAAGDLKAQGENLALDQVRDLTGSRLPAGKLVRRAIGALRRHGIASPLANSTERDLKREGFWNQQVEGPLVESAEP
jgi:hypothetical protein